MVLIISTVLFPQAESNKVAKFNIEMLKKYPPDPSISTLLALGVRATTDGMKVHAIVNVKKGKVAEAMNLITTQYQEWAMKIEGYRYEIEIFMDVAEAYKVLNMEAPEQ